MVTRPGIEVGHMIPREHALREVRAGRDVYTPMKQDAYRVARDAYGSEPEEPEINSPRTASPTGRLDVYFQHFHPAGIHHREGGGAVYFGGRGEGLEKRVDK